MYDASGREAKARTMIAILRDALGPSLERASCVNIGCSTGIIDSFLAPHVGELTGIDIDSTAIAYAQATHAATNLRFTVGDAMALDLADTSIDVVICSQVYEHVPDPARMMREIGRILAPGGVCYFAATNKLCVVEQHYFLPFLSMLPQRFADLYLRMTGKGDHYYEKHLTYRGLRRLTSRFAISDYTARIVTEPESFHTGYLVGAGRLRNAILQLWLKYFYWSFPGYLWVLRNPADPFTALRRWPTGAERSGRGLSIDRRFAGDPGARTKSRCPWKSSRIDSTG